MRFVSRWPGRYSEARQPRSKGGPEAQRHNYDDSKGTLHPLPEGKPLKTQTWTTQNAMARPRPGLKRAIRQKTRSPDVRRSSTKPHHVLKNQRDTPGRVTTGQEPRSSRPYARSVRAQENGSTWHTRKRQRRTNRPGVRGKTMVRVRDVARSNARTAMPEQKTRPPSRERRESYNLRHPERIPAAPIGKANFQKSS